MLQSVYASLLFSLCIAFLGNIGHAAARARACPHSWLASTALSYDGVAGVSEDIIDAYLTAEILKALRIDDA